MANVERFGTFYPIWPILDGKPLNLQWGEIRLNQAEAKALVRNSFQELEEDVDELNAVRALLGQAYGDITFSKKYRFFYNKATFEFCCQRNTGTVNSPIWVDAWCIRFSDGQFQVTSQGGIFSAAGFYNFPESLEEVSESGSSADVSIHHPTKLFFNADDGFGVQPLSSGAHAGQPEIRFTQPFGRAQVFEKTGRVWQVNHDFNVTPLIAQVMDEDDIIVIPDKADLSDPNTAWFYFDAVFAGKVYIASGGLGAHELLPRDPFYLVVRTENVPAAGHLLKPNAELIFDSEFFYVSVDLDTDNLRRHPRAFVSIAGTSTINHGSLLGLGNDDHLQYAKSDGSRPITNHQQFLDSIRVERIVTAEAFYLKGGGSIGSGEITVAETDGNPPSYSTDKVTFHSADFYLTSDSVNKPIVNIRRTTIQKRTQTFPASREWTFNHGLGVEFLCWNTYDLGRSAVIPEKVDISNFNTAFFYFTSNFAGTAVVIG